MVHPLTFEFIGGACVGFALRSGMIKGGMLAIAVGVAALIGFLATATDPSQILLAHGAGWGRVLKVGFPFVLVVYGLVALETSGNAKHVPNWVVRLGDASYSTYLSHVLVLSAIGRCFAVLPDHNVSIEILFVALCIAGTNTVGVLSYRLLERPTLRCCDRWFRTSRT